MRATARVTGVSLTTVQKLFAQAGEACIAFHNDVVRNIQAERIECDEAWAFTYAKDKTLRRGNVIDPTDAGSMWTWIAMDPDTKLIVSWLNGGRDNETADRFMFDLSRRLAGRVQLTTDGLESYTPAVAGAFNRKVDYLQLVKEYGPNEEWPERPAGRYSGARKVIVEGMPNVESATTAHVERKNLTLRMNAKRFARRTNAFSKKLRNHNWQLALHFVYYNFIRTHMSLSKPYKRTPAMAAGLTSRLYDMNMMVDLVEASEPKVSKRGPYCTYRIAA